VSEFSLFQQLAGSLYIVSTLVFAVTAGVVGLRLVALSRRTGGRPERLLGLGLQLTACWGYGVMIFSIIARQASGQIEHPAGIALTAIGWVIHNVGVMYMLRFVIVVFRPDDLWARILAGVMAVLLWTGWGIYAGRGGLVSSVPQGGYWVAFAAIGTYPIWASVEAFRYWGLMRRRAAIGLADPVLVDRFSLWGIASLSAAASIWVVNVPVWMGAPVGSPDTNLVTSLAMIATAGFGLTTVGAYWLTFFPPHWYRARLTAS